jgi:hypothetical protein
VTRQKEQASGIGEQDRGVRPQNCAFQPPASTPSHQSSTSNLPSALAALARMSEPIFPSGWKASLRWWWNNPKDAAALSEKALVERGLAAASIPLVDAPEA